MLNVLNELVIHAGALCNDQLPSKTKAAQLQHLCGELAQEQNFSDDPAVFELCDRILENLHGILQHLANRYADDENNNTINFNKLIHDHIDLLVSITTLIRIFARDLSVQAVLCQSHTDLLSFLVKLLQRTRQQGGDSDCYFDEQLIAIYKNAFSVFNKLAAKSPSAVDLLLENGAFAPTIGLLSPEGADSVLLQSCLQLLAAFVQSSTNPTSTLDDTTISALTDFLLTTLRTDNDLLTQKLCANLLRLLSIHCPTRVCQEIKVCDGFPVLLSTLSVKNIRLQWHVAWTVAQLAENEDVRRQLTDLGIAAMLASLLKDTLAAASCMVGEKLDEAFSLLEAFCAIFSQLVLLDSAAQQLVANNVVYLLGRLLLLQTDNPALLILPSYLSLEGSVFRAWRFLFSLERQRRVFRKLFPPELFSHFIDIGHYINDTTAYEPIVTGFNQLVAHDPEAVRNGLETINHRTEPLFRVNKYEALEQLGAGAFGCVYKVRSKDSDNCYAMKEIFSQHTFLGGSFDECKKSIGSIIQEINIIKQQLKHPNIVAYRRVFEENDKLYIVMDLVQGASLKDHIQSTKEKRQRFTEGRIWRIFIQMVLGLRYLHKEKHIIHRDLNPNNVMLNENDAVDLTGYLADFGLAKQKGLASKLTSVVGTILYNCPELIQNIPYDDRADVWALGCIVYEMCMLEPAFYTQNMLQLANKIVEAKYDKVSGNLYSDQLAKIIDDCLTPSLDHRPDIVEVAARIAERLLLHIDSLSHQQLMVKVQLDKERQRHDSATPSSALLTARPSSVSLSASSSGSAQQKPRQITQSRLSAPQGLVSGLTPETPVHDEFQWSMSSTESAKSSGYFSDGAPPPRNRPTSASKLNQKRANLLMIGKRVISPAKVGREQKAVTNRQRALAPESKIPRSRSWSAKEPKKRPVSSSALPKIDIKHSTIAGDRTVPDKSALRLPGIHRSNSAEVVGNRIQRPSLGANEAHALIVDPAVQLLEVLHKVIQITQTPSSNMDYRRRIVEHFKRNLFAADSTGLRIKVELKKLAMHSRDVVQVDLGMKDFQPLFNQYAWLHRGHKKPAWQTEELSVPFLTYEQLHYIIDSVLLGEPRQDTGDYERPSTGMLLLLNPLSTGL